jgi:uncharacterized protein YndB with AHSA1/START domain
LHIVNVVGLTRIDRSIEIQAPLEKVWRALTTVAELSAWFRVQIEGEIAAGNEVDMISLYPGHEGKRFRVRFVELTPPKRFVWQWHPGAVDPSVDYSQEPRTTVTFNLEPFAGGTRLTVAETGFDEVSLIRRAKVYGDNSQGWTEVLVWLQKHVEAS